jgi:hypothetical protein
MRRICNRFGIVVAVFGLMICVTGQGRADTTLLNLIDAPEQSNTPFSLSFVATQSSTTLSVAGYQVPSFEQAEINGVFLGNTGPNLLGGTWVLTPAASGSDTNTFSDGTPVPALNFGAVVTGVYDTYSQTFATTPGQSYTYDFLYSNSSDNAPSGLMVTTSGAASAVPEPSSLVLAASAALALVMVQARRRNAIVSA